MGEACIAIAGLLASGAGLVSGLFGGGAGSANTGGNANPLPSNSGIVATDDPVRRREDEEGGEGDKLSDREEDFGDDRSLDLRITVSDQLTEAIGGLLEGFLPDFSLPNLGLSDSLVSQIYSLLSGEGALHPTAGPKDIPRFLLPLMPMLGFPVTLADGEGTPSDSLPKKPGERLPAPVEPNNPEYRDLRNKVLDRYFGKDGGKEPAKELVKKLLESSNLTPAEKKYLSEYTNSLYPIPSDYKKLKQAYENGITPDRFKPKPGFVPLVPNVGNMTMTVNADPIPSGGRDVVFENGIVVRQWDIKGDREALKTLVGIAQEDAVEKHAPKNMPENTDSGIGPNLEVSVQIPKTGIDKNGLVIWDSYSYHPADAAHRFTDQDTALMFVNGATKWIELQKQMGLSPQPIRANDFSMPGAGQSAFDHHENSSSIDIAFPGSDGSRADKVSSPNYSSQNTIILIKAMAESVPPGKSIHILIKDQVVADYFKETSINVKYDAGHHDHIDFKLK